MSHFDQTSDSALQNLCKYCSKKITEEEWDTCEKCDSCEERDKRWMEKIIAEFKEAGQCYLCYNTKRLCPGCTSGRIQYRYPELFAGCGAQIRCPECVGYKEALEDVECIQRL